MTDYTPIATRGGDEGSVVMLGSVDVPTVSAFIQAFVQQHYNPKALVATAGPDQGAAFVKAVGAGTRRHHGAERLVLRVPNAESHAMVKEYIAKYGGNAADINADVAEGYSVGQIARRRRYGDAQPRPEEDHRLPPQRRHDAIACRAP